MPRTLLTLILASLCLAFGVNLSTASDGITYQAEVRQNGNIPPDGNYFFHFELYDALESGTMVWTQEDSLQVTSGVVNTVFESLDPSWFQTYPELFLEVTLNGELLGARTRLEAVPYAFVARHAAVADSCTNCGGGSGGDSVWEVNPNGIHYNGGNVGIGTSTPGKPLEVHGAIASVNGPFASSLSVSSDGGSLWSHNNYDPNDSGNGWSRALTFKDGNVGIGTTTPLSPLHVEGDFRISSGLLHSDGIALEHNKYRILEGAGGSVRMGYWVSPNNPNSRVGILDADDGIYLTTDWGDNNHFIAYSNRVGVGLDVDENNAPIVPDITLALRDSDTGFNQVGTYAIAVMSNGTETARFTSTGRLGIGTTNPTATLHVVGDLCVTGQKNRIVETPYGLLGMNAEETTGCWFSTSGESQLVNGRVYVGLTDEFQATVTISDAYPMQVSATFYGEHGGGWYVERGLTGFTIVDPSGSNAPFTWTVKARQKGYEDVNLRVVSTTEGR